MSREAFEETVKEATKQYEKWGVRTSGDSIRREVAEIAEKTDRRNKHRPPARKIDPTKNDFTLPMKTVQVKERCNPEQEWTFEKVTGNLPARAAFHQRPDRDAMREHHERQESKLRQRLGG